MEPNEINSDAKSSGTTSEDRSRAIQVVLKQKKIHNEQGYVSDNMQSNQTRETEDERTGFINEKTFNNSISQEEDVVTFSHFLSKLFPKAHHEEELITSEEEATDHIPKSIEEYNS